MFGGIDPKEILRLLAQMHGGDCTCKECRLERDELTLKDLRELEPNEIESWNVLQARANELKQLILRADNVKKELEALRTLFWSKLETRMGCYEKDLRIDSDRMVLQEYQERG